MDKDKLDEAIESLKVEIELVEDKIKIAAVQSTTQPDVPILNSLLEDFNFIKKELTKIKNGEYLHKDEVKRKLKEIEGLAEKEMNDLTKETEKLVDKLTEDYKKSVDKIIKHTKAKPCQS